MAQFFNKSANNIAKISMVAVVVLAGVGGFAFTQISRSSYLTGRYQEKQQPVQFSHKHHVGDDGIDCRYCHQTVETTASAGMPSTQTCMNCHSQLWSDSPYLEPVRASFRDNKPLEWERAAHALLAELHGGADREVVHRGLGGAIDHRGRIAGAAAATLPLLMMLPEPCFIMIGAACFMPSITERTRVAMAASKPSTGMVSMPPTGAGRRHC